MAIDPPHGATTLPEGDLCIVFTDIEGSTRLVRALDDRFREVLERHNALIRGAVAAHRGVEVQTEGDAFHVVFADPADAIAACVAGQLAILAERWPPDGMLRVRMGVHFGPVRRGGDNYIGLAIHQAARVVPAAHGGQILVSQRTVDVLPDRLPEHVSLLDLGAFHVRDFDEPEHLFQVLHPGLERNFAPPRVPPAAVHNLPPPRTAFVGRRRELEELVKVTDVTPLVSIVGAGGIGKTRLASEVGLAVAGRYDQGVWLVSLDSIEHDGAVADRVRSAMGLADQPGRSAADIICDRLSVGAALVILDNCEHVLDGCVALIESLLGASGTTRILVTSREHLNLLGEDVFHLDPMPVPAVGEEVRGDAVDLFTARAVQARRGFVLDDESQLLVASICRSLDGIPLALELVAAQLSTMTIRELADQLASSFELDAPRRGGDPRQRTLRAAVEWSERLLSDADRDVFRALAVFRGGFDRQSANAVAHADDAAFDRLIRQSLVELHPDAEPPRARLLEPIRQYGLEQLERDGRAYEVSAAHVAFFRDRAAQCDRNWRARGTRLSLDVLRADFDNVSAALEFATAASRTDDAVAFVDSLRPFWDILGHINEGVAAHDGVLAMALTDFQHLVVLTERGRLAVRSGDFTNASEHADSAIDLARSVGDAVSLARALGVKALATMDPHAAISLISEAIDLCRTESQVGELPNLLDDRARRLLEIGDRDRALADLEELALVAGTTAPADVRFRLHYRWSTASAGEDAVAHLDVAGIAADEMGSSRMKAIIEYSLGIQRYLAADFARADIHTRRAHDMLVQVGSMSWAYDALEMCAGIATATGRFEEANEIYQRLRRRPSSSAARTAGNYAGNLVDAGRFADAQRVAAEGLQLAHESGDRLNQAWAKYHMSGVALGQGQFADAGALLDEAIAFVVDVPDRGLLASCMLRRTDLAIRGGDVPAAVWTLREVLASDDAPLVVLAAVRLGAVICCLASRAVGARALGAVEAAQDKIGVVRVDVLTRALVDDAIARARRNGGDAFDAAHRLGRSLTLAQVASELLADPALFVVTERRGASPTR